MRPAVVDARTCSVSPKQLLVAAPVTYPSSGLLHSYTLRQMSRLTLSLHTPFAGVMPVDKAGML